MNISEYYYSFCLNRLKSELVPAMGCTEPIAIAYAAAIAKETLGCIPDSVTVKLSGSIIKNVKSVVIPNTGNMKGIPVAVAAGLIAGKADRGLEVLSEIDELEKAKIYEYASSDVISVEHIENGSVFDIVILAKNSHESALVRICDFHTNVVLIKRNDTVICDKETSAVSMINENGNNFLTTEIIKEFADTCNIEDVSDFINLQIEYNSEIAEEGLRSDYGANIGKNINSGANLRRRAIAKAAAGSDARMSGCDLPVIINSGSGNQGITCSVPVIEFAKAYNVSKDLLVRALVFSNLISIHIKSKIGTLSAFCGAVSAATAAVAGIMYLAGEQLDLISGMIINSLCSISGIVCDGAKSSCASKIAISLEMAFLAYDMVKNGDVFRSGDGLVGTDVEETIRNIGILGHDGMKSTNDTIISLMISSTR